MFLPFTNLAIVFGIDMFIIFFMAPRWLKKDRKTAIFILRYFLKLQGIIYIASAIYSLRFLLLGVEGLQHYINNSTIYENVVWIFIVFLAGICCMAETAIKNSGLRERGD